MGSTPQQQVASVAPFWFDFGVVLLLSAVLAFGGFGLLLAVAGHYNGPAALLLGTGGTIAGAIAGVPRQRERRFYLRGRAATGPALGMCVVAIALGVWNGLHASYHVASDRDPGVYLLAGKWLSDHASLIVSGGAIWTAKGPYFDWWSLGMYPHPGGTVQFQFNHFLPSLLAEAQDIGGDRLMVRVPSVLGAIGLCAVYSVGCRLIKRPWVVLGVVAALGVSLPEVYVARDTFAETSTQVLLWGGILLLLRLQTVRRPGVGLLAGLCIGGTMLTHVDAAVYLIALPPLAALGWLAAPTQDRKPLARIYGAVVLGAIGPVVLGTVDLQRDAYLYYDALSRQIHTLYFGILASVVASAILVAGLAGVPRLRQRVEAARRPVAVAVAAVVVVGLLLAWFVRPAGPHATAAGGATQYVAHLQRLEGLPIQPTRTYAEQSMRWIEWYIGPVALTLAIAGLCVLSWRAIRRGSYTSLVVLLLSGIITAHYIWNPSITPDQLWASRRFVTAGLPLLLLAAGVAVDGVARMASIRSVEPLWIRTSMGLGVLAVAVFPLIATAPVADLQSGVSSLPMIERVCAKLGPDSAVLFPHGDSDGVWLPQTIRSWCNLPAASLGHSIPAPRLATLAKAFQDQGRTLWLAAASPASIKEVDPSLKPILAGQSFDRSSVAATLVRLPDSYQTSGLGIYVARIP
jgi:hypothetical protein